MKKLIPSRPLQQSTLSLSNRLRFAITAFLAIFYFSHCMSADGTTFTPGDLLVTAGNSLSEYTRAGTLVESITIPTPPGESAANETFGGNLIDSNGNVDVASFNSISTDYLSVYNPNTGAWTQHSIGVSGLSNGFEAGLSQINSTIYMFVEQVDASNGYTASPVPSSAWPNGTISTMNAGADGLLYIVNGGSPQWEVAVDNPQTLTEIRQLSLFNSSGQRITAEGLAIAPNGTIFAADLSGTIYEYNSAGTLIDQLNTGVDSPDRIVLDPDGTLVMGSRFGEVFLTNVSFSTESEFSVGSGMVFAGFVQPVPEPPTWLLATAGGIGIALTCRRRSHWFRGPQIRDDGRVIC
jgi:hypothetical protein